MNTFTPRVLVAALILVIVSVATHASAQPDVPPSADLTATGAFDADLFTGAATASIAIAVPPAAGGVRPSVALRYSTATVDARTPQDQAQATGVGWSLDVGGFVQRDMQTNAFTLYFAGAVHELVQIQTIPWGAEYRTKDEMFWKLRYVEGSDYSYWTLWTKDGVRHTFGATLDSRAYGVAPNTGQIVIYKYFLNEVMTASGVTALYEYTKTTRWLHGLGFYDLAVYPAAISYPYFGGAAIGPVRQVVFGFAPRYDWTDTSPTTGTSYFEDRRVASIDVRVGGASVRYYELTHDYAVDRAPGMTWQGGAAGDLTLRAVRMWAGNDALPAETFDYTWDGLLTRVVTALGGTIEYAYDLLGAYGRHRVVSRTVTDGRGLGMTTTYRYTGPYDVNGVFRGHTVVRATDATGAYSDTTFAAIGDDRYLGRPYQVDERSAATTLLRRTINSWSPVSQYPGVTAMQLGRTDVYECVNDTTCRNLATGFTYDSFGNVIGKYEAGDLANSLDDRDTHTEWMVNVAYWLHRPSRVTLYEASGALAREQWLSYDGSGLLVRDERRIAGGPGTPGNAVVTYTYDTYGNPLTTTDARGCTTTTTYETSRTFPATRTSCLGHTTSFAYDLRFGVVTSQAGPNGETTTFSYDALGRLTRVTSPLDAGAYFGTVSYAYLDVGNPSAQRIVTSRTQAAPAVVVTERYIDGLGRAYQTRTQAPGGTTVVSDTVFDTRGLESQVSIPHLLTESAPSWTTNVYDALGRVLEVHHPDGTVARNVYDVPGIVTRYDELGNLSRRSFDGLGRLIRVDEVTPTQTFVTTYRYDASGALLQVVDALGRVTTTAYDTLGRKVAMVDPTMGDWLYAYDAAGSLLSQTDARRQTLTFTYDALGRVLTKRYPDGTQNTWTYDDPAVPFGAGRLTRVVDAVATTRFGYDARGRTTRIERVLDGVTYALAQQYDSAGHVVQRTFPDGDVAEYQYDKGALVAVPGVITNITYDARGQTTRVDYANGVRDLRSYGVTTLRLDRQSTLDPAGGGLRDLAYTYDAVGNVTQIADTVFTASRTFTYDALKRLVSAAGAFGAASGGVPTPTTESYAYDPTGNLTQKGAVTHLYGDPLHPSAITATSDGRAYTYDANGNMLTGAGRALAWDADNRLIAVTIQGGNSAIFAYDSTGRRVRKTVNDTAVTRYPFADYEIAPDGTITKFIAGHAKKSTGQQLFYHRDHLGGVHLITDMSGARVQLVEYDPWGKVSRLEGTVDLTHGFTGQFLDPETGLMYYGGRYYDPALGRFISPDPFVASIGNPQTLNRYSYVLNNPINRIDPSGFFSIGKFFKSLFTSVVKALPAIVVGVAVGVVLTPAIGPVGAGIAAGIAAGAVNTGVNGGNAAQNILIGGALGGVGGAVGPSLASALGSGLGGVVGSAAILAGASASTITLAKTGNLGLAFEASLMASITAAGTAAAIGGVFGGGGSAGADGFGESGGDALNASGGGGRVVYNGYASVIPPDLRGDLATVADEYDVVIDVHGGNRTPEANSEVRGASDSRHLPPCSCAVDVSIRGLSVDQAAQIFAHAVRPDGSPMFRGIIREFAPDHVHLDQRPEAVYRGYRDGSGGQSWPTRGF